jgi:hypothetical protein
MDKLLEIPYFSQYLDITDKKHALVGCGMTCVFMVLKYFGSQDKNLDNLVETGIKENGYCKAGWIHDYLIKVLVENGLEAYRKEKMADSDVSEIHLSIKNGNPVIVSIEERVFDRKKFHMMLITGVKENEKGELEGFYYHDPAGLSKETHSNLFVDVADFIQYWRKMAIFPSKTLAT